MSWIYPTPYPGHYTTCWACGVSFLGTHACSGRLNTTITSTQPSPSRSEYDALVKRVSDLETALVGLLAASEKRHPKPSK